MKCLARIVVGMFGLALLTSLSLMIYARHRSPFDGWLVFEVRDGPSQHLYRMETDGRHLTRLTPNQDAVWEYPQWSPDGRWILAANTSLRRMVTLRPFAQMILRPISTGNFAGVTMRWSPDSQKIVYTEFLERFMNIHVADVDDGASHRLTRIGDYSSGNGIWSPDGERLAFVSDQTGSTEIYVMDKNGQQIQRLTTDSNIQVLIGWSPDANQLYYLNFLNRLIAFDLDGAHSDFVIVQASGRIDSAELSPNAEWMAYVLLFREGIHQQQAAYLVRTDGSERRHILSDFEQPADFTWSPDGQWLAFSADVDSFRQIFRMQTTDFHVEQLTFAERHHTQPDWSPSVEKDLSTIPLLTLIIFCTAIMLITPRLATI